MPGPPITGPSGYETANDILNAAKARLNEELPTLAAFSGKLLDNTQAYTQQAFNTAYRQMQDFLANLGWSRVTRDEIVLGVPPVQSSDPASKVWINWSNYFDGLYFWDQPVLPGDMTTPLKVWERWSGQNLPFPDEPMEMTLDGLPDAGPKQVYNRFCDWHGDALYMPGSTMTMDLRFRYISMLPDIVDNAPLPVRWFEQRVPVFNCRDALSLYIVYEIATAKAKTGDVTPSGILSRAEGAARLIFNRDQRLRQRVTVTRQPLNGRRNERDW